MLDIPLLDLLKFPFDLFNKKKYISRLDDYFHDTDVSFEKLTVETFNKIQDNQFCQEKYNFYFSSFSTAVGHVFVNGYTRLYVGLLPSLYIYIYHSNFSNKVNLFNTKFIPVLNILRETYHDTRRRTLSFVNLCAHLCGNFLCKMPLGTSHTMSIRQKKIDNATVIA